MPNYPRKNRLTIGVLAGWPFYNIYTNLNYLMPLYKGIMQAARMVDCNLLFGCGMSGGEGLSELNRPAWPSNSCDSNYVPIGPWNTDGLIIFTPLHSKERSAYVQTLLSNGFPIQFIGTGENGPTLAVDNAGGVREAVQHLVDHGHKKIAFIAGSMDDLSGDSGERYKVYQESLEEHGLPFDSRCVAFGRHVYDGGYNATRQFLDSGAEFTAILASNDEMALGAMQALKEHGRKIPDDVALIGFDNRLEGAIQKPSLSSVHVPFYHIGQRALESLLDHIENRKRVQDVIRVKTRLIIRESCGCDTDTVYQINSKQDSGETPKQEPDITSAIVMRQAQTLRKEDCILYCKRLHEAFTSEIENDNAGQFERTLKDILQQTSDCEDDEYIWQDGITHIGEE